MSEVFGDEVELVQFLVDLLIQNHLVLIYSLLEVYLKSILAEEPAQNCLSLFFEVIVVFIQILLNHPLIVIQSDFIQFRQGQLDAVFKLEGKEQVFGDAWARYLPRVD